MVAVVLLKVPQAPVTVLAQVTDQVTPALALSLVTVAVRVAVAPVESVVGAPARETVIGFRVVEVALTGEPPPHPASASIVANEISNKTDWRKFIVSFRSLVSRSARSRGRWLSFFRAARRVDKPGSPVRCGS